LSAYNNRLDSGLLKFYFLKSSTDSNRDDFYRQTQSFLILNKYLFRANEIYRAVNFTQVLQCHGFLFRTRRRMNERSISHEKMLCSIESTLFF